MTPEQEDALNRAIAEFEGWTKFRKCAGFFIGLEPNTYFLKEPPDYTRDLNAIVPVVQRWCDTQDTVCTYLLKYASILDCYTAEILKIGDKKPYASSTKQPALALCLAFAKAAGLEWEGE